MARSSTSANIIDSASVMMAVVDTRMNIVVWNRAAELITGRTRQSMTGARGVWELLWPDAAARKSLREYAEPLTRQGRSIDNVETSFTNAAGERRTLALSIRPLVKTDGTVAALVMLGQDVTERHRAEQEQARRLRDMSFLSRAAREFAELPAEADIYRIIGDRLKELTGAKLVFVNSYSQTARSIETRAVVGFGPDAAEAMRLLGRHPEGMVFPVPEPAAQRLAAGRLVAVEGGLEELSLGQIPGPVCLLLEKLLGTGRTYSIGFAWRGELCGNASIIMPANAELDDPAVVEAFVHEAAIALQRRRAEEALHEAQELYRAATDPKPARRGGRP
jgi:PAS domain S-box-containing protein